MKSTPVSALVLAAFCTAAVVSSVVAGGRDREGSTSINGTQANTSTGRSSLGEPVFLIPSTGGKNSDRNVGVSTSGNNRSPQGKMVPVSGGVDRREQIVFTPPPGGPPRVAQLPEVSGTGNVAGANLADHPFSGSILNTGLSKASSPSGPDLPVVTIPQVYVPSAVPIGQGPQGPPTLDRISTASTLPMFKGASSSGSPGGG